MNKFFRNFGLHFDRSFSKGLGRQLAWLVSIVVLAIAVLMLVGLAGYDAPAETTFIQRCTDVIALMIDPGYEGEGILRPFAMLVGVVGLVVFGGMLISVMSNVLERRIESFQRGETTYRLTDHVVVLGFNRSVPSLLWDIAQRHPGRYILLMCDRPVEDISDWLNANVNHSIEESLVLMNGSRTAIDDIRRLSLCSRVREIYIVGEEGEADHDAANMRCLELLAEAMASLPEPALADKVRCHVQIDSQLMFGILQKVGVEKALTRHLNVLPFSFNDIWAQNVLVTCPAAPALGADPCAAAAEPYYRSFDADGITADSPRHVHLIVVGMTEMGRALATNAAHVLHFPNYREGDPSCATRITFIDPAAGARGRAFRTFYESLFDVSRWRAADAAHPDAPWRDPLADADSASPYRYLADRSFMDVDWEFIEGDVCMAHVQDYLRRASADRDAIITVALCADDSDANALACQSLPEVLRRAALQVLVRQQESRTMMDLLRRQPGFENVRAFGMMDECYRENLVSDRFGKLINACYGRWDNDGRHDIPLDDPAAVDEAWEGVASVLRWSNIYSANMLFYRLRSMGLDTSRRLTEEEIDDAKQHVNLEINYAEHNRWDIERLLLGWRPLLEGAEVERWTQNANEDNGNKAQKNMKNALLHLDIMPFSRLSQKEQQKDDDVTKQLWTLYRLVVETAQD